MDNLGWKMKFMHDQEGIKKWGEVLKASNYSLINLFLIFSMSSKCQKYKILSTPPKYFSKIKDNDGGGITYYKVIKSSKKITTNPYELCNSIQKKKKK